MESRVRSLSVISHCMARLSRDATDEGIHPVNFHWSFDWIPSEASLEQFQ